MSKLILLKGLGIQGKSHIVQKLMHVYPNWNHLPQTNRLFLESHPNASQMQVFEHYISQLNLVEFEDGTYISERSPIDYLIYNAIWSNCKFDNENVKEISEKAIEEENKLYSHFEEIDLYILENFDLKWLGEYFSSIPKDHIHKKCYTSRGVYITLQDRWMKVYNHYLDEGKFMTPELIKEFWNFPSDNDKFAKFLIEFYSPKLFK